MTWSCLVHLTSALELEWEHLLVFSDGVWIHNAGRYACVVEPQVWCPYHVVLIALHQNPLHSKASVGPLEVALAIDGLGFEFLAVEMEEADGLAGHLEDG